MAKPIRRSLLIHEVTMLNSEKEDSWGDVVPGEDKVIKYVRLDPKSKEMTSGTGEKIVSNTTLFWDATHSTPVEWKEQSKVKWGEKELTVEAVDYFYDRSKLHHVEVRLV